MLFDEKTDSLPRGARPRCETNIYKKQTTNIKDMYCTLMVEVNDEVSRPRTEVVWLHSPSPYCVTEMNATACVWQQCGYTHPARTVFRHWGRWAKSRPTSNKLEQVCNLAVYENKLQKCFANNQIKLRFQGTSILLLVQLNYNDTCCRGTHRRPLR